MGRRDCRVGGASSFFLRPDGSLWVLECVVWVCTHVFGGDEGHSDGNYLLG